MSKTRLTPPPYPVQTALKSSHPAILADSGISPVKSKALFPSQQPHAPVSLSACPLLSIDWRTEPSFFVRTSIYCSVRHRASGVLLAAQLQCGACAREGPDPGRGVRMNERQRTSAAVRAQKLLES